MLLSQTTKWENVEPCMEYLQQKNVSIDEAKLFDQYHNLCKFIENQLGTNALPYRKMMAHERWAAYFNACSTTVAYYYVTIKPNSQKNDVCSEYTRGAPEPSFLQIPIHI